MARGEEALKWISENIRGVVGYNDISGHINADRFVIFFADDKINKVIRKIETINLQLIKVSESLKIPKIQPYFGVTKWEPEQNQDLRNETKYSSYTGYNTIHDQTS